MYTRLGSTGCRLKNLGLEFSLSGQHIVSHNATPNNDSVSFKVSWLPELGKHYGSYFSEGNKSITKVMDWIKDPAVHMNQVLAVAEQLIRLAAPAILGIFPDHGPLTGGNLVTIIGTNFLPGVLVYFGGQLANTTINSPTSLTVVVPSLSEPPVVNSDRLRAASNLNETLEKTVSVVVQNPDGQKQVFEATYTYTARSGPAINTISPDRGSLTGGTTVTISGANLETTTQVTFGGIEATIIGKSANQLVVTAPAHGAGAVDLVVTNTSGSATKANGYTYMAAPTIGSLSPTSGPGTGGTAVTITGTNLTGTSSVTFDGVSGTSVTVVSDTQVTVVTPSHAAGAVDVVVTTPGGSVTSTGGYTYLAVPVINSISPNQGPLAGGTTVTLGGTGFTGTTSVTLGGSAGTVVGTPTATTITVTTPGGSVTSTGGYTYLAVPVINSISPNQGPLAGGTTVTLGGTGFTGTTSVTFGGSAGTIVGTPTATTITVTTPVGTAAGAVDVVVTTPGGSVTSTGGYTYLAVPVINSISPNLGPLAGGTTVTLGGTGFTGTTSVTFGGSAGTVVGTPTATTITVTTPVGTAAGAVDVVVTTPGGSVTSTGGYTYIAAPTISGISPNSGVTTGGTMVTLSGQHLTGTSAVTFGGTPGTSVTVVSDSQVTVVTPSHAAGVVDVVVTTPGGSVTSTGGYTYVAPSPIISSVSPQTGAATGGATVTINGQYLTGTTSVTFGGTSGTGVTVVSDSQVTVVTPAHASGSVNVAVSAPSGSNTLANAYTYYAIGDAYGGGVVYQIDNTYIYVLSLTDVINNAQWTQRGNGYTGVTNNDGFYNT